MLTLLDPELQTSDAIQDVSLKGQLRVANLDLSEEDSGRVFSSSLTFPVSLPAKVAVIGPEGCGRHRLAESLAGIMRPVAGSITVSGVDLTKAPEALL